MYMSLYTLGHFFSNSFCYSNVIINREQQTRIQRIYPHNTKHKNYDKNDTGHDIQFVFQKCNKIKSNYRS